ncbi:hypothetical protein [Vibrio phage JSF13]|jgi:hypothetical protein|nr:hypothetical protein TUST1-191_00940 [Vibrio phage ICP1_2006_D]ADX88461.1 hypothetical protein TUST1-182_00940 [Vibrio phage ICP1_2006_C]ADX88685.1 hypothetical protein TUST1-159_00925 [Vibrio phage ICP1_2006_B]ADX88911.1 hypothetical protein TUST1-17_00925 [Vibrio phage ICP1_2006_A]ADX89141.1 hypothetical protein TUST1-15_00945 [Vibrio phage ICP1_2005_A]ADX89371.1 hypothetical protein TUST1-2_00955 [Vibrio phage ICP1_2001_A]ADX89598.1 hypothetical protein TUST1-10_00930 [Vibrio phage ICP1
MKRRNNHVTLVVYKNGNRSEKEKLYGVEGVHYINTSHQEVYEALGMYYTNIIVEDGVSEEEKDFCMKRLVSK